MKAIDEIPQPDFDSGPNQTDRTQECAAHGHGVMAEDIFHASLRPLLIVGFFQAVN